MDWNMTMGKMNGLAQYTFHAVDMGVEMLVE